MPPRVVKGPDGVIHNFPQDATDDEIAAALGGDAPAAAAPPADRMASANRAIEALKQYATQGTHAAVDAARGAGAGAMSTVFHGGDLIRRGLGMERVITRPEVQAGITPPQNVAGKVGYNAEQVGEFFLPTGVSGRLARLAEMAKSAGLTMAQTGGDVPSAGISAAITGVMPGAGVAKRAAGALETSAEKNVAQALGATTRDLKMDAAKIAPDMLKRGIRGSREAMRDESAAMVESIGTKIGQAVESAAKNGQTIDQNIIRGNVQLAKDAISEKLASGRKGVIPGYEQVAQQLDALDAYIGTLPADIPIDQAHRLKLKWDTVVDAAGLFGTKGLTSAADKSRASAFQSAAGAFRDMLNSGNTTLAELNSEFGFWKRLNKITEATTLRTQAQTGGLIKAGASAAGAASGFASGKDWTDSIERGALGGVLGANVVKLVQSPAWRTTVTAPMKQKLAQALASGNGRVVADTVGQITASLPAQLRPAFQP